MKAAMTAGVLLLWHCVQMRLVEAVPSVTVIVAVSSSKAEPSDACIKTV